MNTLRPGHAALTLWLNTTGAPGEIAARAGNCVRLLPHTYTHRTGGREDLIAQQIEDTLDPDSSTSLYHGLLSGTFRTFIQVIPCGASGARTHDLRIMRSMAPCATSASCTDTTESCCRCP